jgi:hypothetical protein
MQQLHMHTVILASCETISFCAVVNKVKLESTIHYSNSSIVSSNLVIKQTSKTLLHYFSSYAIYC